MSFSSTMRDVSHKNLNLEPSSLSEDNAAWREASLLVVRAQHPVVMLQGSLPVSCQLLQQVLW